MELNSGTINNADLELFYRLKLELISAFNNMVIRNGYYLPCHQYQFFKIINSNLNKYFNSRIYVGFFEKLFITLKIFFIFNFKY